MFGKQTSFGYILPESKPRSIVFSQNGAHYVTGIRWTGWNRGRAVGHGTSHDNDCKPSCGEGTYTKRPATLIADRRKSVRQGYGGRMWYYSRLHRERFAASQQTTRTGRRSLPTPISMPWLESAWQRTMPIASRLVCLHLGRAVRPS